MWLHKLEWSVGFHCRTLALSIGCFLLMEEYDDDPFFALLSLARVNEIDYGITGEPGWIPFSFEDSIVYNLSNFEDLTPSATEHSAAPVRYLEKWRDDGMSAASFQAA